MCLFSVFPSQTISRSLFLWLTALIVLVVGALVIAFLHVRVRAELVNLSRTDSSLHILAHAKWRALCVCCTSVCGSDSSDADEVRANEENSMHLSMPVPLSRNSISTERLHVRVDVLSSGRSGGCVVSAQQQLSSECMSYIVALVIGAALTSMLPVAPADDCKRLSTFRARNRIDTRTCRRA